MPLVRDLITAIPSVQGSPWPHHARTLLWTCDDSVRSEAFIEESVDRSGRFIGVEERSKSFVQPFSDRRFSIIWDLRASSRPVTCCRFVRDGSRRAFRSRDAHARARGSRDGGARARRPRRRACGDAWGDETARAAARPRRVSRRDPRRTTNASEDRFRARARCRRARRGGPLDRRGITREHDARARARRDDPGVLYGRGPRGRQEVVLQLPELEFPSSTASPSRPRERAARSRGIARFTLSNPPAAASVARTS